MSEARITTTSTLRDLAFIVCTELDSCGATAVLTGGGAATIYSLEAYASRDLDFVLSYTGGQSAVAIKRLGFEIKGSTYVHPETPFSLDFPPGPLSIGEDYNLKWETMREGDLLLHIISPTDSVLDRFAAYVAWGDKGSLESAALVANAIAGKLDWKRIESWCESEGVLKMIPHLKAEMERLAL